MKLQTIKVQNTQHYKIKNPNQGHKFIPQTKRTK